MGGKVYFSIKVVGIFIEVKREVMHIDGVNVNVAEAMERCKTEKSERVGEGSEVTGDGIVDKFQPLILHTLSDSDLLIMNGRDFFSLTFIAVH
ncbi:hypothetical protein PVK06_022727 [Gossypium arboreum]|uniref:Uncharacterized protein n=1 Tax=Gossypium arboreum TaxID=29729 RepID=A0ABR0P9E8_GOSAR|nr:hypothetical protein PVK06_022727 [Gossypium arboreum]